MVRSNVGEVASEEQFYRHVGKRFHRLQNIWVYKVSNQGARKCLEFVGNHSGVLLSTPPDKPDSQPERPVCIGSLQNVVLEVLGPPLKGAGFVT